MMLLINQVVGVAVERRDTLERFLGDRINKLRDQLHGEDVGEGGVYNPSHISMLANKLNVGVIFPNKK